MNNYKVKAIKNFTDATTGQFRVAQQSEFVVSEERYNQLLEHNAIELIEIIEEIKEETTEEKVVKKTSKKKSK